MSRKHHYLKTGSEYFQAVKTGKKKFELRVNDRDFKVYDIIHLEEFVDGAKTGRVISHLEIQYILNGGKFGLDKNYCILNW